MYILVDLVLEYDPLEVSITTYLESIALDDFHGLLLTHEHLLANPFHLKLKFQKVNLTTSASTTSFNTGFSQSLSQYQTHRYSINRTLQILVVAMAMVEHTLTLPTSTLDVKLVKYMVTLLQLAIIVFIMVINPTIPIILRPCLLRKQTPL